MNILNKTPKRASRRNPETQGRATRQYTDYYKSAPKRNSPVTSKRNELHQKTDQIKRASAKTHIRRLPTYIALTVIVASLLYSSIISNTVIVMTADNQGLHSKEYYETVASDILKSSVTNKTKFTFDSQKFKQDFIAMVPEAKSVNLSLPLAGKKPVVGITFVKPLYQFRVSGKTYIVGENGVVIANAKDIDSSKKDSLKAIQDDAPLNVTIGNAVLLDSDVVFLEQMFAELKAAQIDVGLVTLPLGAGELYVKPSSEPYIIKFALSGDARQQVGAYLALLASGNLTTSPTEYIDVRLGERVFVK